MKAHAAVAASAAPAKRRWKGLATVVLALVFFSLLVPLAFLLGVHNRFPSGYAGEERSGQDAGFGEGGGEPGGSVSSEHEVITSQGTASHGNLRVEPHLTGKTLENLTKSIGHPNPGEVSPRSTPVSLTNEDPTTPTEDVVSVNGSPIKELERTCQREFGSYCLWATEHKEEMKDALVKKLKDQLFVARAYYPSITKLQSQESLSKEMKQNIQDHERMLSEAIVDADLPSIAGTKMERMGETIAKAKALPVECVNVDKKLRQILDLTEDEAQFHMRQSAFLYRVSVQTTPKSLHCLSMRLTLEYFKNYSSSEEAVHAEKVIDKSLHHYVIFSKNVLASSVTINSTVVNSKVAGKMVFHVLTDRQNYFAMKFWFARNSYNEAVVQVLNIEKFVRKGFGNSGIRPFSSSEEFRISIPDADQPSKMKTEYTSILGHSHFILPDLFPNLEKVIVLDDDVVIQKDLAHLWNLDMEDKVIGAIPFCHVKFGQLKNYLGSGGYNDDSCLWMSGLNILNLEKWRERDITGAYLKLLEQMQLQSSSEMTWRSSAMPVSLRAFDGMTFPIENSLVLSGLGKDYGISTDRIHRAAVLHYNGNMKPWLELGVPKYKSYWRKFLTHGNRFMDECNANL